MIDPISAAAAGRPGRAAVRLPLMIVLGAGLFVGVVLTTFTWFGPSGRRLRVEPEDRDVLISAGLLADLVPGYLVRTESESYTKQRRGQVTVLEYDYDDPGRFRLTCHVEVHPSPESASAIYEQAIEEQLSATSKLDADATVAGNRGLVQWPGRSAYRVVRRGDATVAVYFAGLSESRVFTFHLTGPFTNENSLASELQRAHSNLDAYIP